MRIMLGVVNSTHLRYHVPEWEEGGWIGCSKRPFWLIKTSIHQR